jgi:hypothetical protein
LFHRKPGSTGGFWHPQTYSWKPSQGLKDQAPRLERLRAEDVVHFQRLVDLGEPLGAVGSAAATALVERQF